VRTSVVAEPAALAPTVLLAVNVEPSPATRSATEMAPTGLGELRMRVLFSFGNPADRLDPVALRPRLKPDVQGTQILLVG
jgi:hypothetical protein